MTRTGLGRDLKPVDLARSLNRSAATLSRALDRNGGGASGHRHRGRHRQQGGDRVEAVHRCGGLGCSPRPVAPCDPVPHSRQGGRLTGAIADTQAVAPPDTPERRVSHETIDTATDALPRGALRTEMSGGLCFGHAKRRPRGRGQDRWGPIPDRVSIHGRPPGVAERRVPGHREGDLIKGADNRPAVGTLVERTTLFTVLPRMEGTRAESARQGFPPRPPPYHGPKAPVADRRSGSGKDRSSATDRSDRGEGLLCRPAQLLAAWHQQEHTRSFSWQSCPRGVARAASPRKRGV